MTTTTTSFSPVRIGQVDFVNLTPHAIVLRDGDGVDHTIPPSGQVARISTYTLPAIPAISPSTNPDADLFVRVESFGPVGWEDFANWVLPLSVSQPKQRVCAIVSSMFLDGMVTEELMENADCETWRWLLRHLVAPNTDESAIRNEKGHIVAVRKFRTALLPWQSNAIGLALD